MKKWKNDHVLLALTRMHFDQHEKRRQIRGGVTLFDNDYNIRFTGVSVELPWQNNEQNVSAYPDGVYAGVLHKSPRFQHSIWLLDVPGRSEILWHRANHFHQLRGCTAIGRRFVNIDEDGLKDVNHSRSSMRSLYDILEGLLRHPDEPFPVHVTSSPLDSPPPEYIPKNRNEYETT